MDKRRQRIINILDSVRHDQDRIQEKIEKLNQKLIKLYEQEKLFELELQRFDSENPSLPIDN